MLVTIKIIHTIIWAFMASCIVALPALALTRRFRWAAVLSAIVLNEIIVLGLNGGRCPLTDWAARYTAERTSNFDIYLPLWLAHYNKAIFGTLFVAGEVMLVFFWRRRRLPQTYLEQELGKIPKIF